MVDRSNTIDEAIAYVWDIPDMVLEPFEKERLVATLLKHTGILLPLADTMAIYTLCHA